MYAGQVVEKAPTATLFSDTKMPYTEALLRSIPKVAEPSHTRLAAIPGRPPDLVRVPAGCRFAPALPLGAGPLPRGAAAPRPRRHAGPRIPLLVPRRHAGGHRGSGTQPGRGDRPGRRRGGLMAGTGKAHLRPEGDALLRVEDLVVEFNADGGKVKAVSGISLDVARRRDARAGRRVGMRQVHDGPGGDATAETDVGQRPLRRPRAHRAATVRAAQDPARAADDLPGPDLVVEPAPQDRRHRGRGPRDLARRRRRGRGGPRSTRR